MKNVEAKTPQFVVIETKSAEMPTKRRQRPAALSKELLTERGIIHPGMKDIDALSAFRDLRTSVVPRLRAFNSNIQVTAVNRGGGASFSAINFAVSCTFEQHSHALLVDCNFERPSLAKTLELDVEYGLYDFLTGRIDSIGSIVHPTGIPRLSLVPSGIIEPGDHIEFFSSERMRVFLNEVKNRYTDRVVILDTPPVLHSTDAKILAEVVDYAVIVLPYKGASPSKIERVIKTVGKEKIVGMVLNN